MSRPRWSYPGFLRRFASPRKAFPHLALMGALVLLCIDATSRADGVDVDRLLQDLEDRRGEINSYGARFVQKKTLALFDEEKISTGVMLYKAPRQMIWKYDTSDKTQMRIDGESVSFYFPELKQIEVYPAERGKGVSHFFFAFEASADELKESFEVFIGAVDNERLTRIDLVPKSDPIASELRDRTHRGSRE
jgi:outer membrane lipoprotein-sorting protein